MFYFFSSSMPIRLLIICSVLVMAGCRTPSHQDQPAPTPTIPTPDIQTIVPLDNEAAKALINDQRVGETRFLVPTQAIRTRTNDIWQWNVTDETITRTNTQSSTQSEWLLAIQSPLLLGTQMVGHSLIHTTNSTAWISMKDGLGTRTSYLVARTSDTGAIVISEPWCIPLFILLDTSIICSQLNTDGSAPYTTLTHRTPQAQRMIYPTTITSLHTNGTHLLWTHQVWSQTELLIYDTQKDELLGATRLSWSIGSYHPFIIRDHRVYRGNADQWPSPQSDHSFSSFMRWDLRTDEIITLE